MYQIQKSAFEVARLQAQWYGREDCEFAALRAAQKLYRQARATGWWRDVWSRLTRRPLCLLDLHAVEKSCAIRGRCYAGIQPVSLAYIRGSAGRCQDFDGEFRPRHDRTRDRWLGIAVAQQLGIPLPPVGLIQIGSLYFVQDGHHRISVARAMGQRDIDAEVIVWQTAGPLPWERKMAADRRAILVPRLERRLGLWKP